MNKISKYIRDLKSFTPCADCKQSYGYWVMDFDHVEGEKTFNMRDANLKTMTAVRAEIAKCEIVCANCHREREYQRKFLQTEAL